MGNKKQNTYTVNAVAGDVITTIYTNTNTHAYAHIQTDGKSGTWQHTYMHTQKQNKKISDNILVLQHMYYIVMYPTNICTLSGIATVFKKFVLCVSLWYVTVSIPVFSLPAPVQCQVDDISL